MAHVDKIQGSLLLVHGLIDENVHFRHTVRETCMHMCMHVYACICKYIYIYMYIYMYIYTHTHIHSKHQHMLIQHVCSLTGPPRFQYPFCVCMPTQNKHAHSHKTHAHFQERIGSSIEASIKDIHTCPHHTHADSYKTHAYFQARLINAMIRAQKHYELLLFPDERHSPRRYVCMYVCMYAYMYVYKHTYI
jgi:hypothetical protein